MFLLNEDGILFTSVPLLGQPLYLEGLILPNQGNTDASRSAQTFSPPGVRIPCQVLAGHCPCSSHGTYHIALRLTFCCPQCAVEFHLHLTHSYIFNSQHRTLNIKTIQEIYVLNGRDSLSCIFFDLRVYLALLLVKTMQLNFLLNISTIYEVMVTGKKICHLVEPFT